MYLEIFKKLSECVFLFCICLPLAMAKKSIGEQDVALHISSQGLNKIAQDILSQFVGPKGKVERKTLPELIPAVKDEALIFNAKNVSMAELPSPLSIYLKKVLHLFGQNSINLYFNIIDPVYSGEFNLVDFSISKIDHINKTMEVTLALEIKGLKANTPAAFIAAKGVLPAQKFQELDITNSPSCQSLDDKNMQSIVEATVGGGIQVSQGKTPVRLSAKAKINLMSNQLIEFETIANNLDPSNGANLSIKLFDSSKIKIPDFYVYYENQDSHLIECEKLDLAPIKEFITSTTVMRPLSVAITRAISNALNKEVAKKINEQLTKLNIQVPLAFGGQLRIPDISPQDQMALKLVEDTEINDFLDTISYSVHPGIIEKESEGGIALSADFTANINNEYANYDLSTYTRNSLVPASSFKFSSFQDLNSDFSIAIAPTAVNKLLNTTLITIMDFLAPLGFSYPDEKAISFSPIDDHTLALIPKIKFSFGQIHGHPYLRNQLYVSYNDTEFAPYDFLVRTAGKTVMGLEKLQGTTAREIGSEIEWIQKYYFNHQSLDEVASMMRWFYNSQGELEFPIQFTVSPTIVEGKPMDKYTEEEIDNIELCQSKIVAEDVSCPEQDSFIKISISPPQSDSIYQNVLNIPQETNRSSPILREAVELGMKKIFSSLKTFEFYIPFSKISILTGLTPSKIIVTPSGHLVFQTKLKQLPFNLVQSMKDKKELEEKGHSL